MLVDEIQALNSHDTLAEDDLYNQAMISEEDDLICMPDNMHLLTTYFTFNLIDLPSDFHNLVKQYF